MSKKIGNSTDLFQQLVLLKPSGMQGAVYQQFQQHNPSHAYLLTGSRGIGKRTYAKTLASLLYCESGADAPCLACSACKQVFECTHPQILSLFADDGKTIGVDQVRTILTKLSRYSLEDGFRIVMIEPLEKLTDAAQNALLKQLEEPQEHVIFLLMAHEKSAALGTIASRCISVPVAAWDDSLLRKVLSLRGYSENIIENSIAGAAGNIGTALETISFSEKNNEIASYVNKALSAQKDADIVSISSKLKDDKESVNFFLLLLEQAIANAIRLTSGELYINSLVTFSTSWQKAIHNQQTNQMNELLREIFAVRKSREYSINLQSSFDMLLTHLMEAQNEWQKL